MSNGFSDGSEYDDEDIDIDIESDYESDSNNDDSPNKTGSNEDSNEKMFPIPAFTKKVTSSYGKRVEIVNFNVNNVLHQDEQLKQMGRQYNLCYRSGKADNKIVKTVLQAHGFKEVNDANNEFNVYWSGGHIRPHVLRAFHEFQKVNHFPRSSELTRKDRLFKNVQRMQTLRGSKHFDFIPPSFLIPAEYSELCQYSARDKGPLIVKPVALSRGRGIFLCPNPSQIPLEESLIVCRYINNPFLIDGLKFDLRVYVLVTSFEPLIVYLYEEGLARFATERYQSTAKHLRTQCMHLTNYSVNKKNGNFVHNEDADVEDFGNKWSLGALLRYLKSQQIDTTNLMMKIEDIVIKSLISVEPYISSACRMFQPHRGNCFELYGYDIIIDENLKPWLLEVNLSPSLACESPLDFKIKSHLITDMLSLTGIICQNPSLSNQNKGPAPWITRPLSNYFGSFSRLRTSTGTSSNMINSTMNSRAGSAKSIKTNQNNSNSVSKSIRRPIAGLRQVRSATSTSNYAQTTNNNTRRTNTTKQPSMASQSSRSNDEVSRIVRRFKEDQTRRGGWVCIFPTEQSLETYGQFMGASAMPSSTFENSGSSTGGITSIYGGIGSSTSSFYIGGSINRAIHARLFPNKHINGNSNSVIPINDTSVNNTRSSMINCRKRQHSQRNYSATQQRLSFYERKLGQSASQSSQHPARSSNVSVQENRRNGTSVKTQKPALRSRSKSSQLRPISPCTSLSSSSSSSCVSLVSSTDSLSSPDCRNMQEEEVEHMVDRGSELNVTEARVSFGQYLSRVRTRLIIESKSDASEGQEQLGHEQVDLILRFLRRADAASGWRNVPAKAPGNLATRQSCLATNLHHFIQHYDRQTLASSASPRFMNLVTKATEPQLERLLSNYTKKHKTANIFLNPSLSQSKTEKPKKPPVSSNGDSVLKRSSSLTSLSNTDKQSSTRKTIENSKSRLTRPLTGATKLGRPPTQPQTRQTATTTATKNSPYESISNLNYESNSISRALDRLAQEHRAKRLISSSLTNILNNQSQQTYSLSTNHNSQYSTNKNPPISNSANNNQSKSSFTNNKPPISQSNRIPFIIKRF